MEIVGFTISEFWPQRKKRVGPGTIRTWFATEYDGGIDEARAKATEHLEFLNDHWPDRKPQLVVLHAENGGW